MLVLCKYATSPHVLKGVTPKQLHQYHEQKVISDIQELITFKLFFWDLDIYYLSIEIILVVQNCLHGLNKTILHQYRVHTLLNKLRRSQLLLQLFLPLCFRREVAPQDQSGSGIGQTPRSVRPSASFQGSVFTEYRKKYRLQEFSRMEKFYWQNSNP